MYSPISPIKNSPILSFLKKLSHLFHLKKKLSHHSVLRPSFSHSLFQSPIPENPTSKKTTYKKFNIEAYKYQMAHVYEQIREGGGK